jgi:hypothetical protein
MANVRSGVRPSLSGWSVCLQRGVRPPATRIVEAAAALICEHGVAGTGLEDIGAVTATSRVRCSTTSRVVSPICFMR